MEPNEDKKGDTRNEKSRNYLRAYQALPDDEEPYMRTHWDQFGPRDIRENYWRGD